jgi:hypothetical protein
MFEKHYMSRAETRAMASEHPIGDATGGAAYGERNDPVTATVAAVGSSIGGGILGSRASKNAANIQSSAADRATQMQYDMNDRARADSMPWLEAGRESLGTLRSMTQPGGEFSRALSVGDVQNEPGYQFGMQQGLTGTARQLSKMQGRNGGATLKALTRFGTDYGATKYNDAWNRANADRGFRYNALANLSGTGQQAVNQITSTGMNAANNAGNLTTSGGAARAAGLVGSANAIGNGITGAGNSLLQYQMFNKLFPNDGTAGNIAKGNALMAGYGGGQDIYSF